MNLKVATKPWKKPFLEERKIIINVSTLNSLFFQILYTFFIPIRRFLFVFCLQFLYLLSCVNFWRKNNRKNPKNRSKRIFLLLILLCNSSYVEHKSVLLNKEQFCKNLLIPVVFLRTIPWYNEKVITDVNIFNSLFFSYPLYFLYTHQKIFFFLLFSFFIFLVVWIFEKKKNPKKTSKKDFFFFFLFL